jgi:uncharacterized membrane protein YeaQ/YmgE (transglycosylase-associated protein family)
MALDPGGIIAWIVVVLVAGFLASHLVSGHGFGVLGDILVGIVGAFLGGFVASLLGFGGSAGLIGSIVVAFIGAAVLLMLLRALAPGHTRAHDV